MLMHPLVPFPFAVALLACLAPAQETDWSKILGDLKFSLSQAIETALAKAKDGKVVHAEIERDKGRIVLSIDVACGTKNLSLVLDSGTGDVLESETEDEDHSQLVKDAKVSLTQAIVAAIGSTGRADGRAIEAQLLRRADKPVFDVKVYAGGQLQTVSVDAVLGTAMPGAAAAGQARGGAPKFTERFAVQAGELVATGRNPFMILEPGYVLVLEGVDKGKPTVLTVTVLDEKETVDGVETRVVEERETVDGKLVEVSRNFFAISRLTANVYYFGEDVDIYEDGKVKSHEGAWRSGVNGARFGLMFPGTPLLGSRYYQEIAPEVAMDRAEIVSLDERFECAAGKFEGCLKTEETTPLESDVSHKVYAPGIGLAQDGVLRLTKHGKGK